MSFISYRIRQYNCGSKKSKFLTRSLVKKQLVSFCFLSLIVGCAAQNTTIAKDEEVESNIILSEHISEDLETTEMIQLSVPPVDDGTPLTKAEAEALGLPVILSETTSSSKLDLEAELAPEDKMAVELHFKYFTHRGRASFERYLKRLEQYFPYIKSVFERRGIPVEIGYLALVESGFNPNAVSHVGATGLWQFMPYTGKDLGLRISWWIDERKDPYKATEAAAEYLLWLYARYENWYLAIAAYNAGPGKISRALDKTSSEGFFDILRKNHTLSYKSQLRLETRQYVPKFIAVVKIMRNLKALGFEEPNFANKVELASVQIPPNTDLSKLASRVGLSWREFIEYNPAYKRQVSPNNIYTVAYIPTQKQTIAMNHIASALPVTNNYIPRGGSSSSGGWFTYKVKQGDTLSQIASRYNLPLSVVRRANNSKDTLHIGQQLVLPRSAQNTRHVAQNTNVKSGTVHKVVKGDNLYDLAKKYSTSVNAIASANNISEKSLLRPGQTLHIPKRSTQIAKRGVTTYTVKNGDTIWGIARKFNVSVAKIVEWNKLNTKVAIKAGDTLQVYIN